MDTQIGEGMRLLVTFSMNLTRVQREAGTGPGLSQNDVVKRALFPFDLEAPYQIFPLADTEQAHSIISKR